MVDVPDLNIDDQKRDLISRDDDDSLVVGQPRKKRKVGIASYLDNFFEKYIYIDGYFLCQGKISLCLK